VSYRIAQQTSTGEHQPEEEKVLIRTERLGKIFRTQEVETHALSDIDLTVYTGEYVAIAGPSGCGKSTLLAILGLLESPSSGHYRLKGIPVERLNAAERSRIRNREIGFIFQSFNLIGDLTVAQNVELPLKYRGLSAQERRGVVAEAVKQVGMSHRLNHYPAQLSGGQQQRVAVARALVGRPSILLADEPTGNLDTTNGASVMDLLDQMHRAGATILMVTHDPRYAERAERTVRLVDGRILNREADS